MVPLIGTQTFLTLLLVTFVVALLVSFAVERAFKDSIARVLFRIIPEEISEAWLKYIRFAIYVVGVSAGVNPWNLDRYITPPEAGMQPLVLDTNRWILELYQSVIQTLQSIASVLLIFFLFALVAYVIVRAVEVRKIGMEPTARERREIGNGGR
jgi:hypothetical protein